MLVSQSWPASQQFCEFVLRRCLGPQLPPGVSCTPGNCTDQACPIDAVSGIRKSSGEKDCKDENITVGRARDQLRGRVCKGRTDAWREND